MEQAMILETRNYNGENQWYNTYGGLTTIDKVFLLSIEEVVKYFGDSGQLEKPKSIGIIKDRFNGNRSAVCFFNEGNPVVDGGSPLDCAWWLRSPGSLPDSAAAVTPFGYLFVCGFDAYGSNGGGVRPALWLKLN